MAELLDQWTDGVVDATHSVDAGLANVTGHGLLYWTGVGVVIVAGVAALRWGFNKITGKSASVSSTQADTRNRLAGVF